MTKISCIIPAGNEAKYIKRAIDSVVFSADKSKTEIEVIVVCNGTTDATVSIAEGAGATVITRPAGIGVSRARNIGAWLANSEHEILIFLDADSYVDGQSISEIIEKFKPYTFGTVLGKPDTKSFLYSFFFFIKNTVHRLGLYKGSLGGLMFFDRQLFHDIGGYAEDMAVDEIYEISRRARAKGGKYILITDAYAYTSMRRFEKYGPINMLMFWLKTRYMNIFKKKVPGAKEYKAIRD